MLLHKCSCKINFSRKLIEVQHVVTKKKKINRREMIYLSRELLDTGTKCIKKILRRCIC